MTTKDLLKIHSYLKEVRENEERFVKILECGDIDVPLQRYCGENEDATEVRARILKQTQEKVADLDRLLQLIRDETINADFECKDGKVYFKG